ncbi:DNA polymerase III subunit delta [Geomicrobium sediminis]|uniref:DNA polymerase III subunit delta n=1 Tax=Geomicrobium sediminis TaxID=1347788 RepID=A0ABS2PET6_9BACL|nr:DNA polymerase III subunit delta [Geomicrobium sediminis]MBM7633777.1 DNA polymerase-3 subunit delta [Geomicrobium sediminis]
MTSYIEAKKDINRGKLSRVYLIYGMETYMIDDLTQSIVKQVLREDDAEFNLSQYDLRDTAIQVGLEDIETPSFFGTEKVIVMKHAFLLTGQKRKDSAEHDLRQFERYLDKENQENDYVIFTVEAEKLDERKKIVKKLKKHATVVQAAPLAGTELERFVNSQAKQYDVTFLDEAITLFLEVTTPDLQARKTEIEKLALYVGPGGTITKDTVNELVSKSLEDNVFTLIDAISSGQAERALMMYQDLVFQGEEPIKLVALIGRQIRMMSLIIDMEERGYSQQKMAQGLGVPPFVVGKIRKKTTGLNPRALHEALSTLAEVDYKMKTGYADKETAMVTYIARLSQQLHEA